MSIPKRKLGSTGNEVSVIGFGASPLGSVFKEIDEDEGVAAVHEAVKLGINFFDTSPFYGKTRSEQVLGRALKDIPRNKIVVATKVGRYGEQEFDFSAERVTESVNESLRRLNLDYVDIIYCHDIEFGDLDQIISETLPALQKVKEKGLAKFVGITGLPLKIFRYIIDRVPPGTVDVVLSYCHYTLVDRSLEGLLPYLQDRGIGVVNASPLSMGLLTSQGPPPWHPAPEEVRSACKTASELCASRGTDIAKLAIKEAIRDEAIPVHLVGMCTREEVRRNVQTVLEALGEASDPREAEREQGVLREAREILWPVQGRTWPSGRPENN
uniref:L-galactose dehydrogenase n=1 Tax=Tetraselmis sp. GSL018 TaxID=582737 RepID=A0A061RW14_9CHLO